MSETRMPTQKRSIDKRNRIIEMGFELICNNGYYNTTTADIAKYAGVSTGIVYQYFNDKKDIFIDGVKNHFASVMYPVIDVINNKKVNRNNFEIVIKNIIDKFINQHTISKRAHEELLAMSHIDDDIANIFKENELLLTDKIVKLLITNNIKSYNLREKVHISIHLVEDLCHEIVYHKHDKINYDIMTDEVINIIKNILK